MRESADGDVLALVLSQAIAEEGPRRKVHGLRAMLSAVDEASLSHLALFSSTSGFYGNVGQSDYAAANEVLNKFAHAFERRFPACRAVVFDWGPWDGGMVTPFLKSLFE